MEVTIATSLRGCALTMIESEEDTKVYQNFVSTYSKLGINHELLKGYTVFEQVCKNLCYLRPAPAKKTAILGPKVTENRKQKGRKGC